MPPWLTAIAQAIGLTDFLARWFHDEEIKKTGEQIHESEDLKAQVKQAVDAQTNTEAVHRLSDDELNQQLRDDGAGH